MQISHIGSGDPNKNRIISLFLFAQRHRSNLEIELQKLIREEEYLKCEFEKKKDKQATIESEILSLENDVQKTQKIHEDLFDEISRITEETERLIEKHENNVQFMKCEAENERINLQTILKDRKHQFEKIETENKLRRDSMVKEKDSLLLNQKDEIETAECRIRLLIHRLHGNITKAEYEFSIYEKKCQEVELKLGRLRKNTLLSPKDE